MSGVARVKVSKRANCEPAAPLSTRRKTENGSAPPSATSSAPKAMAIRMASAGNPSRRTGGIDVGASSRIGLIARKSVPRHHESDLADRERGALQRPRYAATIDDGDP